MSLASPSPDRPAAGPRAGYLGALAGILAVGFYLRWHQLLDQILADDEWHAVRTAVRETYLEMFTSFSSSAVPLFSMLYKALADNVGGSELVFRLPLLLAGLALIVVFPWVLPAGILQSRGRVALAGPGHTWPGHAKKWPGRLPADTTLRNHSHRPPARGLRNGPA